MQFIIDNLHTFILHTHTHTCHQHNPSTQVISILDMQAPPSLERFEDVYIVSDLMETDLHRIIYSRCVYVCMVTNMCACVYVYSRASRPSTCACTYFGGLGWLVGLGWASDEPNRCLCVFIYLVGL